MAQFLIRNTADRNLVATYQGLGVAVNVTAFGNGNPAQKWQIPVSATNKGLVITSTAIPPGYPLSPAIVRSVVPNVTRAVWDFVATGPPVSGRIRIRNPSNGEFWGLPTLAENTPIQLGPAGAVDHQIWVLELVVNV